MSQPRNPQKTLRNIDNARGKFLAKRSEVERSRYAWAYLRGLRRLGDDDLCRKLGISAPADPSAPSDLDLADAEHYMYGRFLAGSTGDPAAYGLVGGYEVMKGVKFATKDETSMRTDPRFPVTPPSLDSVDWGARGVRDGLLDYAKENPGKSGEMGSAIKTNWALISGQFSR